jgi:hypothetical protein
MKRQGVITEIEYRQPDGSSQWTTIGGKRYATAWSFDDIDWKLGDLVEFEVEQVKWLADRATNIKRVATTKPEPG